MTCYNSPNVFNVSRLLAPYANLEIIIHVRLVYNKRVKILKKIYHAQNLNNLVTTRVWGGGIL